MDALSMPLVATVGALFIHTASFAVLGPRAHQYPGGAMAYALVVCLALPSPTVSWVLAVLLGTLLGHVISWRFWRWARPEKPAS